MFQRLYTKISEFFFEVRSELKKISFPTRAETLGSTGVVLVLVVILSVFLWSIDHLLIRLVRIAVG